MANMFSGKTNKQIPTSLNECTQEDATVSNLHTWAKRLENWGQILFVILIIIGIISTIAETINMADINEDMAFMTCITSAITWGLYAFIEYCAYHVLALLISALASITQNAIISANVALYQAAKSTDDIQELNQDHPAPNNIFSNDRTDSYSQTINRTVAPDGMWVCKNCGTNNSLNYGQCKKCGKFKS